MTVPAPSSGTIKLTLAQANEIWNWTLCRQGLHPEYRLGTVAGIAAAGLGVHAARLPTPFATVIARAATPHAAARLLGSPCTEGVTTLRCMRKTLHILPLGLAAAAHAATRQYRIRDATRQAYNVGVNQTTLAKVTPQIINLLTAGALPHRMIEEILVAQGVPVTTVRTAVKIAWEQGTLTYLNQSGCWNQEHRAFALTTQVHPGLDTCLDTTVATKMLIETYFDRYSPATIKDAMWWSALSRTAVTSAMNATGWAWLEVITPWALNPAYIPEHIYDRFGTADADTYTTELNFLAHEDMALKAYFETRTRYLATLSPEQAFNQIGEVLPTIILDGRVVGTWKWNPATRTVKTSIAVGQITTNLHRRVTTAAESLTQAMRTGWRERKPTNANPHIDPNQLSLAI